MSPACWIVLAKHNNKWPARRRRSIRLLVGGLADIGQLGELPARELQLQQRVDKPASLAGLFGQLSYASEWHRRVQFGSTNNKGRCVRWIKVNEFGIIKIA